MAVDSSSSFQQNSFNIKRSLFKVHFLFFNSSEVKEVDAFLYICRMQRNADAYYIQHHVRIHQGQLWVDGRLRIDGSRDIQVLIQEAYAATGMTYLKFFKMDTLSKLGILASHFLLETVSHDTIDPFQKKLIFQNTHSSLATDTLYAKTLKEIPSPALFVYTLPNIVMGEIAIRYGFKGENTFFITPEFSPEPLSLYIQTLDAQFLITGYLNFDGQHADVMLCLVTSQDSNLPLNAANLQTCYSSPVLASESH